MATITDGDRNFTAVNERLDAGSLEAGVLSKAINIDLTRGKIEARKGFSKPKGYRTGSFSFPFDFELDFDEDVGNGQIYGAAPFTSRHGSNYHMQALSDYALRIHNSGSKVLVRYPYNQFNEVDTFSGEETALFVQADNGLYMFRGQSRRPLFWDGEESGIPAFVPVSTSISDTAGTSVIPMPNSSIAIYYLNRLWVLSGRDEVAYSDIGVFTDFNITNSFKIDSGGFDSVVGFEAFGDNAIVVFKETSLDILENLQGDLTENGTRTRLSNSIGLAARDCVTDVGRDLWFLSPSGGVFSVRQAFDNKLQSDSEPLSSPLQPVFDRINWGRKDQFRSAFFDNKYLLSVALDNSEVNNVLIVYSFITDSWHGYHTSDTFDAEYLYVGFQNMQTKLFAVENNGSISDLYVGWEDEVLGADKGNEFTQTAITRGYGASDLNRKQFRKLSMDISTWRPSYTVTAITDGVNEDTDLLPVNQTKNRLKYGTLSTPQYDPTNTNDDHGEAYRKDYSVAFADIGFDFPFDFPLSFHTGKDADETYTVDLGDNGIDFNRHQRTEDPRGLRLRGDYLKLKIVNTQGRMKVHSAVVSGFHHSRTLTTSM